MCGNGTIRTLSIAHTDSCHGRVSVQSSCV